MQIGKKAGKGRIEELIDDRRTFGGGILELIFLCVGLKAHALARMHGGVLLGPVVSARDLGNVLDLAGP